MFDLQSFENDARENGVRYWLANEFMEKLGYESWSSFKHVIQRAMANCLQLQIDTEEVFISHVLEDGSKSWRLTRFACFLVAMAADSKKPEVAKAQVALAAIAERLIESRISEHGIARIEERGKLTSAEKQLGAVAMSAGVQAEQFGIFKNEGFRGMYDMSLERLKGYKNAPDGKPLYDFMGLTELAANTFRVTQTAERIKNNRTKGIDAVAKTAHEVGSDVRKIMIKSSGTAPEDLALEPDIKSVKKQIKTANKEMKKLDSKKGQKKKTE